tara:strand:+ start:1560 stop:1742 length:183 start_codon:yes stop_codon:yes gene_type:complete
VLTITQNFKKKSQVWLQSKSIAKFSISLTPTNSGGNLNVIVHNYPRDGQDEAQFSKMLIV